VNHELVWPTEEEFGGKVPPQFAAEGALNGDGLERKFLPTGRHIAAAPFAGHHEDFAA
jgi:hypothetical protein